MQKETTPFGGRFWKVPSKQASFENCFSNLGFAWHWMGMPQNEVPFFGKKKRFERGKKGLLRKWPSLKFGHSLS